MELDDVFPTIKQRLAEWNVARSFLEDLFWNL
jgi:hypothetical protein